MTTAPEQKLPKPAFGSPCNGCGRCCLAEQCAISLEIFDVRPVCPALEPLGDRLICGLMAHPLTFFPDVPAEKGAAWSEFFRLAIGSGLWCDAVEGDVEDRDLTDARHARLLLERADEIFAARERLLECRPWE
jgi:hypothetical protein